MGQQKVSETPAQLGELEADVMSVVWEKREANVVF
jgi:predicted transcriptional regulator